MPPRPPMALIGLALLVACCGGAGVTSSPALSIDDCVRAHGMKAPSDAVPPPQPTIMGESTTVFRLCEWPPPPYAQSGYAAGAGYSEIRVTRVPWAQKTEVTNASAPDRVSSPCAEVELQYLFAKQGPAELQAPVRFTAGARASIGGQPFTAPLPFSAGPTDVVVVHNLSYSIAAARCLR